MALVIWRIRFQSFSALRESLRVLDMSVGVCDLFRGDWLQMPRRESPS